MTSVTRPTGQGLPRPSFFLTANAVLPTEDDRAFEQLTDDVFADLRPSTTYGEFIAFNLAELEWERHRCHRLIHGTMTMEMRRRAETTVPKRKQSKVFLLFDELTHPGCRNQAEIVGHLKDVGVDVDRLFVEIWADRREFFEPLQKMIASIESRRRKLLADFERVEARQSQMPKDIKDAELVPDDQVRGRDAR